jgi:cytochrome P450
MMYCLARHPQWQDRVRAESIALGDDALGFDDQGRLEALGLVTQEVLRRYPPLSSIPRTAVRDCEFDGYRIPAGTLVSVFPIHTHHMEEWWSDPFAFDPDRFAPGREEHKRHSHLYAPFGGGVHVCLGRRFAEMQIAAIMHQLVRRVRWKVPRGYEMPVQEAPISKPRDGLPLELVPLD